MAEPNDVVDLLSIDGGEEDEEDDDEQQQYNERDVVEKNRTGIFPDMLTPDGLLTGEVGDCDLVTLEWNNYTLHDFCVEHSNAKAEFMQAYIVAIRALARNAPWVVIMHNMGGCPYDRVDPGTDVILYVYYEENHYVFMVFELVSRFIDVYDNIPHQDVSRDRRLYRDAVMDLLTRCVGFNGDLTYCRSRRRSGDGWGIRFVAISGASAQDCGPLSLSYLRQFVQSHVRLADVEDILDLRPPFRDRDPMLRPWLLYDFSRMMGILYADADAVRHRAVCGEDLDAKLEYTKALLGKMANGNVEGTRKLMEDVRVDCLNCQDTMQWTSRRNTAYAVTPCCFRMQHYKCFHRYMQYRFSRYIENAFEEDDVFDPIPNMNAIKPFKCACCQVEVHRVYVIMAKQVEGHGRSMFVCRNVDMPHFESSDRLIVVRERFVRASTEPAPGCPRIDLRGLHCTPSTTRLPQSAQYMTENGRPPGLYVAENRRPQGGTQVDLTSPPTSPTTSPTVPLDVSELLAQECAQRPGRSGGGAGSPPTWQESNGGGLGGGREASPTTSPTVPLDASELLAQEPAERRGRSDAGAGSPPRGQESDAGGQGGGRGGGRGCGRVASPMASPTTSPTVPLDASELLAQERAERRGRSDAGGRVASPMASPTTSPTVPLDASELLAQERAERRGRSDAGAGSPPRGQESDAGGRRGGRGGGRVASPMASPTTSPTVPLDASDGDGRGRGGGRGGGRGDAGSFTTPIINRRIGMNPNPMSPEPAFRGRTARRLVFGEGEGGDADLVIADLENGLSAMTEAKMDIVKQRMDAAIVDTRYHPVPPEWFDHGSMEQPHVFMYGCVWFVCSKLSMAKNFVASLAKCFLRPPLNPVPDNENESHYKCMGCGVLYPTMVSMLVHRIKNCEDINIESPNDMFQPYVPFAFKIPDNLVRVMCKSEPIDVVDGLQQKNLFDTSQIPLRLGCGSGRRVPYTSTVVSNEWVLEKNCTNIRVRKNATFLSFVKTKQEYLNGATRNQDRHSLPWCLHLAFLKPPGVWDVSDEIRAKYVVTPVDDDADKLENNIAIG